MEDKEKKDFDRAFKLILNLSQLSIRWGWPWAFHLAGITGGFNNEKKGKVKNGKN